MRVVTGGGAAAAAAMLKGQGLGLERVDGEEEEVKRAATAARGRVFISVRQIWARRRDRRLKRDKQVLMMELIKLRQQQQTSRTCLQVMEQRLKKTERKQHQMMNFLARAMKNPDFLQQLVQEKDRRKELEEVFAKSKRRRSIDQGPSKVSLCDDDDQLVQNNEPGIATFVKVEPQNFGDVNEFEGFELEKIALDMVGGIGVSQCNNVEEDQIGLVEENENRGNKALGEVFWEDLLNEGIEQAGLLGVGGDEDGDDVNVLAEQLGYLSSTP
ncbi:hypothetical protein NL676_021019 [Syzygium grande]|nr:hypothetical protein NL676_021019 [Syzygium grande]